MAGQQDNLTLKSKSKGLQVQQGWVVATAIVGVVAGSVFQQALYSSVPLGLSVLMAEANRRRSEERIERTLGAHQQVAGQMGEEMQDLQESIVALQEEIAKPAQIQASPLTRQHLLPVTQQIHKLQKKYKQLELVELEGQRQELAQMKLRLQAMAETVAGLKQHSNEGKGGGGSVKTMRVDQTRQNNHLAILVDAANIYHCGNELGVKVNYDQLIPGLQAGFESSQVWFYTGLKSGDFRQQRFLASLRQQGYQVVTKRVVRHEDGKEKANLDVELALEMVKLAERYSDILLLSGDGDLACAVRAARQKGARVEVISFRSRTSQDLIRAADDFRDLTDMVDRRVVKVDSQTRCIKLVS
uniref:NYN domain-containing protein n=1 Tax=Cyanothece sp. (strain PCC 7425 / ATCC 29141) TaxID=395961 RepID=B8HYZ1_CYAP4